MNNSSCNMEVNIFEGAQESVGVKIIVTLPWPFSMACAIALLYFTYYEFSGNMGDYRPLINQLTSYVNFLGIFYVFIVNTIDLVRFWIGPLAPIICDMQLIFKVSISTCVMFLCFFNSLAKFSFICIWKRIPVMEDSLIALYLALLSVMYGLLTSITKFYLPGRTTFNQAYCKGEFYQSWLEMSPKMSIDVAITGIPFLAYLVLTFSTTVVKLKNERNTAVQTASQIRRTNGPKSLGGMVQNYLLLFAFFAASAQFAQLNSVHPGKWKEYPYNLYHYFNHFFSTGIVTAFRVASQWMSIKRHRRL